MKERKHTKFKHLDWKDRIKIEKMRRDGCGIQEIADALRVNYTTVYRELKRPGVMYEHLNTDYTTEMRYSAELAQAQYEYNLSAKGRPIKLADDYELAEYIEEKIADEKRSPAAVLMDIELEGRTFKTKVCEKTIYNYISKNVFLRVTNKDLPYRSKKRSYKQVRAARVQSGDNIDKRPRYINERIEPFHWEMDTVKGTEGSTKCALMMTERVTRKEIVRPMQGATMANVVECLNSLEAEFGALFPRVFRSITVDNGSEFCDCKGMETGLDGSQRTKLYYCDPYCSWERGSNENLNRMFRRIFPKGTNFDEVNNEDILKAADWMNNYPRKILGGLTADILFEQLVAKLLEWKFF